MLNLQDLLDPWGLKRLKRLLKLKGNVKLPVAILTGTELSKESGIAPFRGENGIWGGHRQDNVARADSLKNNPSLAIRFYNKRRRELLDGSIKPNAAHLALTKLANVLGEVFIVTHNTDNLHELAGSVAIHLYGSFLRNKCDKCKHSWESLEPIGRDHQCPECNAKAVRPDVVFLKESPYRMDSAEDCLTRAKIFISLGSQDTELTEKFLTQARMQGAICIEINPKPTAISKNFDLVIKKPLTQAVPLIVDFLIYQP